LDSPSARDAVLTAYAQSLIKFKARQLSRKPGFSRSDEEDVAQELTVHLLAQAHQFDAKRASASTFAERVISTKIAMLLRSRRRQKRAAGFTAQSLEQTHARSNEYLESLRNLLTEEDHHRRLGTVISDQARADTLAAVVEAVRSLPMADQDICRRLIEGSAASVARDLGISRRRLRKDIEPIRRHFESRGLKDS